MRLRFALPRALLFATAVLASQNAFAGGPKRTGSVTVNCPVIGATVSIDGEEVGTVPLDPFELHVGAHVIRVVRAGLIAFEQELSVHPGDSLKVVAIAKEARSLLTIASTEKGGEVLLDGKVVGPLPIRELTVAPGEHSLFIRKEGLQPYKETFTVQPFREFVANPPLKRKDGSAIAGATSGLGLDLDAGTIAKNTKPGANAGAGLDLDLDFAPAPPTKPAAPAGKNGKPAPAAVAMNNDFDLDLDFAPPPPTTLPAPTTTSTTISANAPSKVAANTPAPKANPSVKPAPATKPAAKPVELAVAKPVPTKAAFVADPVARAEAEEDEEEEYDPTPIYKKKWVWASAAVVAIAGVAVPIAMGKTGGYREVHTPDSACRSCLVVMNQ